MGLYNLLQRNLLVTVLLIASTFFCLTSANAQMRQVYLDSDVDLELKKCSFYSASEGYIAFQKWIGYTTDSGRTFTKKYITPGNVNFNGYSVNLTFGFYINGVKAFNQTRLIAYGHYGLVPAILYSIDGGNTFTLIFHSLSAPLAFKTGITDMVFPQNGAIGYAVDADRILKSTDGGVNWSENLIDPDSYFTNLEALDNNNIFALSTQYNSNQLVKTTTGGLAWSQVTLPTLANGKMNYACFLSSTTGWVSMSGDNGNSVYKTIDGGTNWVLVNDPVVTPFKADKIKFLDANTGYALSGTFSVYKTTDGGAIWEPLPRNNTYSYLGYTHVDFAFFNANQLWAGGGPFLELSTNGGGTPLPKAYFKTDTTGIYLTNVVNLLNYSKQGYTYRWLLNNQQIATSYNANYTRNISRLRDTVTLIVSNGANADTLTKFLSFAPPVVITSFTPLSAGAGATINIKGSNFTSATSVRFGGTAASSFTVLSDTAIRAVVGNGSSGSVTVSKTNAVGSLAGFTFIAAPIISSFNPDTAATGTLVIITGNNFTGATSVSFGGVPAQSFNVINATTISAIVPSGNSGGISVTTPGGTATLAGFVSKPTIASFTPAQGTMGTILVITGSSFTGATSVTIGGVNATSFTVNNANQLTAVVGPGASGSVTVTAPGGTFTKTGFTWIAPPVINSFSPARGPAGTTVTITGTGFNNTTAGNIVLFGSVKAIITAASNTSLTVTVPLGTIHEPISVVANNLIGVSRQPFISTFANGGSITANSFAGYTNVNLDAQSYPYDVITRDIDKDGKNDLIVSQNYDGSSSSLNSGTLVFRNTTTGSTPSFASPYLLPGSFESIGASDMDGDGKEDIIMTGEGSNQLINLYRNISTPGNILFDNMVSVTATSYPDWFCLADVDGDGKTDIITELSSGSTAVLYKNTSEPGAFSFKEAVSMGSVGSETNAVASDLNGDGKPEIIFAGGKILPNNSTADVVSFGAAVTVPAFGFSYIAVGDVDNDGKNDLIAGDNGQSKINVYKNTGVSGTISFAPAVSLNAVSNPTSISVGDMDGDGRVDITARLYNYNIAVFKNTSSGGNISFAPKLNYRPAQSTTTGLAIADINNDGKNDILATSRVDHAVSIYMNEVKREPFIVSFTPQMGVSGTVITLSGYNFTGATSVSFNGVPATSFSVVNDSTITAVLPVTTSGDVTVTNTLGSFALGTFAYGVPPVITSVSTMFGTVNSSVTINGSNFGNTASNNIVRFGSAKAKVLSASATSITAEVPFGSEGKPISVTVNNLTAYSNNNFITNFVAAQNTLTPYSFNIRADAPVPGSGCLADMDGDGKVDIVSGAGILRNISSTGLIKFAGAVNYPSGTGAHAATGDLDGDGKLDVATAQTNIVSLYRNNSTPGIISLEPKIDFLTSGNSDTDPYGVAIKDLNSDGKPDIAVPQYDTRTIAVLQNKSSVGNLSFVDRVDYAAINGSYFTKLFLEDIDGDNKPEMIATTASGSLSFYVFQNTSTTSNISFTAIPAIGNISGSIQTGDVDMDGKIDVVIGKSDSIYVFRNISTTGNISFAKFSFVSGVTGTPNVCINDVDGDGKPEIISSNSNPISSTMSVFKNNSTPGNISISPKINYSVNSFPVSLACADADNDGKADIFIGSNSRTSILRNNNGENKISISSFTPVSAVQGTAVAINGNGFSNITNVSFGNVPADSFIINSDNLITAYPGNGASGSVIVSNSTGMASLTGFTYSNKPALASIVPATATAGTTVVITGANLTGVTAVSFGGVPAQSFIINSATSISAVVATAGSSGNVKVMGGTDSALLAGFIFKTPPVIYSFTPASGTSGTVAIKGKNFTNTIAVDFAGRSAQSFTVVSDDSLRATIGTVNTGNITVTTDAGSASLGVYTNTSVGTISGFYPTVATQGTQVLITGTNMGAVTSVSFGNTPAASFSIATPTSIIAVVDTGSSGSITISTATAQNASITGFTYVPPTQPGIASFAPARAAAGISININGVNFNNVTAVSIGGVAASSFVVVSPQLIKAVVANAASGSIAVTTSGGTATKTGFVFTTMPYINSFSPKAAIPGSKVIIYGANFNTTAAANIVYFGAVKATVVSAEVNKLIVAVPKYAIPSKITVTTGGLTAYSNKTFIPLFASAGPLSVSSFNQRIDSALANKPGQVSMADIDIDGKADLTVCATGTGSITVSLIKNQSDAGSLLLSPPATLSGGLTTVSNIYTDYDGDGLLDLSCSGTSLNPVYVAKNNSTAGNISLATGIRLTSGSITSGVASHDIDGDGKPDIAVCSTDVGAAVFRNTTAAAISFSSPIVFGSSMAFSGNLIIEDVDGDSKPDIIMNNFAYIYVLRNISTAGNIAFEAARTFLVSDNCNGFTIADINEDGYPEVIAVSSNNNQLIIFENNCRPGFIHFNPAIKLYPASYTAVPVVQDMDGDGKLDIISTTTQLNAIYLFRNNSSSNTATISYDAPIELKGLSAATRPVAADIDGDNKPEIIVSYSGIDAISFFKNNTPHLPAASNLCAGSNTSFVSNVSGTNYQWQVNTGNGFVNITNGGNYAGATSATLQLNALPSTWYGNVYRCRVDNKLSNEYSLKFVNNWTGAVSSSWNNPANWSCNVVPDGNADVNIENGTVIVNENGICRTLTVSPTVSFTVNNNVQLTITH